jgi:hypothetical protein
MYTMRNLTFALLFAAAASQAATVFPSSHPGTLKEAQAQGLQQLSAEELKAFIPGTQEAQGVKGGKRGKLRIFRPDGSFQVEGFEVRQGTWRIDSANNTWCRTIYKEKEMRDVEQCFASFRAPDGIHYFDFDVGDSFYAGVWRAQSQ